MRGPRLIFALVFWLILFCLFPVFSSDTPIPKEALPAEEDPLNPYVEGMKEPAVNPEPAKTRPPKKRKPMKAPKKIPKITTPIAER